MNRIRYRLLAAVATGLLSCLPLTAAADEAAADGTLAQLFDHALEAEGQEYVSVRDQLLSDPGAVEFLEPMTLSTNLQSRVIARAMLGWGKESELNEKRVRIVENVLNGASQKNGTLLTSVPPLIDGDFVGLGPVEIPKNELRSKEAVPFLLELALKGPNSSNNEGAFSQQGFAIWGRAFAAGVAGGYEDPDVFPVLVELLKNSAPELRLCSVIGLNRTGNILAVDPLIDSLSDEDEMIREITAYALINLTGENLFGAGFIRDVGEDDGKKYRMWWEENKEEILLRAKTVPREDEPPVEEAPKQSLSIGYEALKELFDRALTAEGKEYFSIRDELLGDSGSINFLFSIRNNNDLHRRVLSSGIYFCGIRRNVNEAFNQGVFDVLDGVSVGSLGMLEYIKLESLKEGFRPEVAGDVMSKRFGQDSTSYLLELVIKGPNLPATMDEGKQEWYSHWARCFAAGVVGGNMGQDIVFVLIELLETSESSDLRTMAAVGLRRTKSPDAVEPLIAALSDKEESVRKAASQGLKEITGMDFGADAQQYQTWWSENKDSLKENVPE